MLPLLLMNVITGLVADKAQDLAKDHVSKMIDDVLPPQAKGALDAIIKADPTQAATSLTEFLDNDEKSTYEASDLELNLKITFNPETGKFDVQTDQED